MDRLQTSWSGLSSAEAQQRLVRYGPNVIAEERGVPLWRRFVANLTSFFAILLWVAAALSFAIGSTESAIAIVAVIFINAIFSFLQEYRAEQAVAALKKLLPASARVRRDGQEVRLLAAELVPGDILILDEGDSISADARLLQESNLRTNNSTLTGESEPVRKSADPIRMGEVAWTQMPNLIFAGTSVAAGTAEAVVIATGMETELGQIAHLTQSVRPEVSPLQVQIGQVATTVTRLSVVMGVVFFLIGLLVAHLNLRDGAIFAIGIVLANVPEGLLPTVSLALSTGVQRLAQRNALVKKLSAVETLGAATVICSDKTGTLTQNQMTVREAWVAGRSLTVTGIGYEPKGQFLENGQPVPSDDEELQQLLRAAVFCNNARLLPPDENDPHWDILGDPTEAALLVAAAKAGIDPEQVRTEEPRVLQLPFDSARKRMSVILPGKTCSLPLPGDFWGGSVQPQAHCNLVAYVKGAPKEVLSLCTSIASGDTVRPLADADRSAATSANDRYARAGLRVLAMAVRGLDRLPAEPTPETIEQNLAFIGLMAMQDPPRPEVEAAVHTAHTAGIRVVMITGDYGLTAESIARKLGIVRTAQLRIFTSVDLDRMGDEDLRATLASGEEVLFARVAPEDKLRIVQSFQALGGTVAVTGDGVNDAPALKRADIGVAMGRAGTDVAKEAAAMILTDDNFATIVSAAEEGRAVYDNIRKFVTYIFAHLAGEAVPYIFFALFNLPLPLTALQILAIDLGTETLPALALGTEPPEPDVMLRPPRPRQERLLNRFTLLRGYFFLGLLLSIGVMFGYFWRLTRDGWHWGVTGMNPAFAPGSLFQRQASTMVFLGIVIMQIANVFACRTERVSVFRVGFFSNRLVFVGIAFELAFAALLIYVPFLQRIFGTAPIGLDGWLILFAFTPMVFLAEEGRKALARRLEKRKIERKMQ